MNCEAWACKRCGASSDGASVFCLACGYKPNQLTEAISAFVRVSCDEARPLTDSERADLSRLERERWEKAKGAKGE